MFILLTFLFIYNFKVLGISIDFNVEKKNLFTFSLYNVINNAKSLGNIDQN